MFSNDGNEDEKRGIEEQYATAVGSSNLRVGNDSNIRTPGDLVASAGMSPHRTGKVLNRLLSEWNSGATPGFAPPPDVNVIAKEIATKRWQKAPGVYLRIVHSQDFAAAEAEAQRRLSEAADWQDERNAERFRSLRSLPAVRAGLLHFVRAKGWDGDVHLVAAVIQRFLAPNCPVCSGRKATVVPGTGRTGKRACGACKGVGLSKVPHGGQGRSLLAYMTACIGSASADISEGNRLWDRTSRNKAGREAARAHGLQATRAAIDEEAKGRQLSSEEAAVAFAIGKGRKKP